MATEVDPETVATNFSALGDPLRIRILLALAETRQPSWDQRGMSYSDLRATVDVEDGGRFNYHLNELRDRFVRGTDGTYWLTTAGSRVVDEMYARTFSGDQKTISGSVRWTCPADDEQLNVTFDDGLITMSCPVHGELFDMSLSFSSGVDRDLEELVAWGNRRALWYLESVAHNICPHCSGRFSTPALSTHELDPGSRLSILGWDTSTVVTAEMCCQKCDISFELPASQYALTRPPTIAFLHDHGIDYRSIDLEFGSISWNCESKKLDDGVRISFEVGEDQLKITLDRLLNTRSYRRNPTGKD